MQTQFLLAQYINSADAANARRDFNQAAALCRQALQLASDYPEAWYNLGIALRGLGQSAEALQAFEKTRARTLNSADAQNSIGLQLIELGAYTEAEKCLKRALSVAPNFAYAHSNLGMLRQKQKRFQEAETCFRKAIALQPEVGVLYVNLGATLNTLKKHADAEACSREATRRAPNSPEAWNNLGSALYGLKNYEEAEKASRQAIKLDANSPEAWRTLGCALYGLKRYEEAADCLCKSSNLNPDAELLAGMLFHTKMRICDWRSFDQDLVQLTEKIKRGEKAAPPFAVLGLTGDLNLQRKAAESWIQGECPTRGDLGPIAKNRNHQKIRIGYYSADFHNHATSYLMAELFELHDKNKFELIAFSFGPDKNDEMRQRVSAAFNQFIDVRGHSDKAIAQLSREMEIDIAVDLKGYTEDCRPGIFAYRAAPLQVNYLGYPGTMGADYIDYIIADPTLIPGTSQAHYTEKVAYLPNTYQVNDTKREMSSRIFTREECGIPPEAFVFCCFNNPFKITPSTFNGWMRILKQVENSVLWLLEDNPFVTEHLKGAASRQGISTERLVFAKRMPLDDHLARHQLADLFMDTLPYNAHTTASDALWTGLPVLTCAGEAFSSRVAASLLNAIDLPELIARNQEEYETLAITLASHPEHLARLREKIRQNRQTCPLFNTALYTTHLEMLYSAIYERWLTKAPPEHLTNLNVTPTPDA